MTATGGGPWWRGARGEWYFVGQVALMALVFLGPRGVPGWTPRDFPYPRAALFAGAVLVLLGALLFVHGLIELDRNATPLPYPKDDSTLVTTGVYGLVRHPIYGGGILMAFAWALLIQGWLTLVYAGLLFRFLDLKARREERWLSEKFPGYGEYRRRVRKLVPFIY